ncbi:MAG TPA: (2Fe-2S) ferredoxin domain-containing protein [Polyangia bacterium]|nr:(2Fe-2S) ferredoxin domain-containing protein [Polyangia bacterium]
MNGPARPPRPLTVLVCRGPTCGDKRGGNVLYETLRRTIAERGLGAHVTVGQETCFGHCLQGPNILVCDTEQLAAQGGWPGPDVPSAVLYNRMTESDLARVIDRHLTGGMVVRPFLNRLPIKDG